uniref:Nuclear pore complex protein n=1 Tax=Blastobotrys adeninivorans TaxID=409370 RepID=A0A060T2J3_BLAAD
MFKKDALMMDAQSQIDDLEEFAKALEQARLRGFSDDAFDLLESYGKIATQTAIGLFESGHQQDQKYDDAELEIRLWKLAETIFGFRTCEKSTPPPIYKFSSNAVVQENYMSSNTSARENWLLLTWLQQGLEIPNEPEDIRVVKWMYTKNQLRQSELNSRFNAAAPARPSALGFSANASVSPNDIVKHMDPDAPLRENKKIAQEDEEFDNTFFRYIFELLLGNHVEKAQKMCERTGNLSLKLAIRGTNEYIDPEIDGHALDVNIIGKEASGIDNKTLWRRMCYQMSQAAGIGPYERAVYGLLCGDLQSVLPLCDSWEKQFIAYMLHIVYSEAEIPLLENGRISSNEQRLEVPVSGVTSPRKVLDVLAHSRDNSVRQQSENLLRNLIGAIINDTVGLISQELSNELKNVMLGIVDSNELVERPEVLRVCTHLILFLHQIDYNNNDETANVDVESMAIIIRAYIQMLCMKSKEHLVPVYMSYLPDELAVETYSFLLANITDHNQRKNHLELGRKYNINMDDCVRAAVDRVFSETSDAYDMNRGSGVLEIELAEDVSATDLRLYRTAEWFVDASLWEDAVHSSVHVYRRFLLNGRVESSRQYGNRVAASLVLKKYDGQKAAWSVGRTGLQGTISDTERVELMEYDVLVNCLNAIQAWKDHYLPVVANGPVTAKEVSKEWQTGGLELIESAYDQIMSASMTWMTAAASNASEEEQAMMTSLRTIYVPYLLLCLVQVLTEGQLVHKRFLKSGVELANTVASDDSKLYTLFEASGNLALLVSKITDAFVDGIEDGEEGIYDAK